VTLDNAANFYVPWAAALAASAVEPVAVEPIVLHFQGIELPLVQTVLAVAGVLMARPLARKKEAALPLWHFLIVTLVMLVAAVAWVSESRPGVLFAFVVSIGLGFSGYALIEAAGTQIENFVKRIFDQVAEALRFRGRE